MRYPAAAFYALAAASGNLGLVNVALIGACVFLGTVLFAFAIEGIVQHQVQKAFLLERLRAHPLD